MGSNISISLTDSKALKKVAKKTFGKRKLVEDRTLYDRPFK